MGFESSCLPTVLNVEGLNGRNPTVKYAGRLAAVALVGALSLAACGTDNNTAGNATVRRRRGRCGNDNGLSGTINAAGSSAQANAMDEWKKSFRAGNSGASLNYQPSGSGAGVQAFIQGTVAFAGSDSALKDERASPPRPTPVARPARPINIPMVTGPIARRLQPAGRRRAAALAQDARRHLQQQDHQVGRRGHQGRQPGGQAAVDADPGVPPLGRVRHQRQLHQVPQGDGRMAVRARQGMARRGQGPGREGLRRHRRSRSRAPTGAISYVELSYADNSSSEGQGRQRRRRVRRADHATARARRSRPPRSRARATTSSSSIDYATKTAGAYPIVLVTYEITCEKGLPADQSSWSSPS